MKILKFVLGSRGPINMARRTGQILSRFGHGPERMGGRFERFMDVLDEFDCSPTFPITALPMSRNPRFAHRLVERGAELAVHAWSHIDLASLDVEGQGMHMGKAIQLFRDHSVPFTGFRAPYLHWNEDTMRVVEDYQFQYSSNQTVWWDVLDVDSFDETQLDGMNKALAFYAPVSDEEMRDRLREFIKEYMIHADVYGRLDEDIHVESDEVCFQAREPGHCGSCGDDISYHRFPTRYLWDTDWKQYVIDKRDAELKEEEAAPHAHGGALQTNLQKIRHRGCRHHQEPGHQAEGRRHKEQRQGALHPMTHHDEPDAQRQPQGQHSGAGQPEAGRPGHGECQELRAAPGQAVGLTRGGQLSSGVHEGAEGVFTAQDNGGVFELLHRPNNVVLARGAQGQERSTLVAAGLTATFLLQDRLRRLPGLTTRTGEPHLLPMTTWIRGDLPSLAVRRLTPSR